METLIKDLLANEEIQAVKSMLNKGTKVNASYNIVKKGHEITVKTITYPGLKNAFFSIQLQQSTKPNTDTYKLCKKQKNHLKYMIKALEKSVGMNADIKAEVKLGSRSKGLVEVSSITKRLKVTFDLYLD